MICCVMPAAGGGSAFLVIMAAVAAVEGIEWVLARIWWIAGSAAIIAALAVAAVIPLMRWAERRDSRRLPLWTVRDAPASVTATVIPQAVPAVQRPELAGSVPAIEHNYGPVLKFYGAEGEAQAARVIRQALMGEPARAYTAIPGDAGEIITEE
jgi:hypothetical protein